MCCLSLQHRPMKKVRKSLALDVMDCRMTVATKLKPIKPEPNHSTQVWGFSLCIVNIFVGT